MEQQEIDTRERELMDQYVRARTKSDELNRLKSEAQEILKKAEEEIVQYLSDCNKKSTGKYEDLGLLTIVEPTPRPRFDEENKPAVFDFLRMNGGDSCIKEGIHPSTFSSFIREKIMAGVQIPEFIQVYYQPQVQYRKP